MMENLLRELQQPEYLHVLLNPLPAPAYRAKCAEAAAKAYEGFQLQ